MANDRIEVKITADDKQFTSTMGRVQKTAKSSREKISLLGTSVSGLGFAMGSATGKTGQLVTGLANFAGVIGVAGPVGMGLTAAALGVAALVKQYYDMEAATKASAKAAIDNARANVKANEAMLKAMGAAGAGEGEMMIERLAIKRMEALDRGNNLRAHALKLEIQEWKHHVEEAKTHKRNAEDTLAIAAAELKLASGAAKAGGAADPWDGLEGAFSEEAINRYREERRQMAEDDAEASRMKWQDEFAALAETNKLEDEAHKRRLEEIESEKQARIDAAQAAADAEQQRQQMAAEYWTSQGISSALFLTQLLTDQQATDQQKMQSGIEYLSQMAIGEGAIMAIKGAGMMVANPAAGAPYLAGGLALIGLGASGMAGAEGAASMAAGALGLDRDSAGPDTGGGVTTRAPTTSIGPGTAGGEQQTIINYYFGGPVFGNRDDAARAVSSMNERGRRLDGLR